MIKDGYNKQVEGISKDAKLELKLALEKEDDYLSGNDTSDDDPMARYADLLLKDKKLKRKSTKMVKGKTPE